jgi:hypothetical protein
MLGSAGPTLSPHPLPPQGEVGAVVFMGLGTRQFWGVEGALARWERGPELSAGGLGRAGA